MVVMVVKRVQKVLLLCVCIQRECCDIEKFSCLEYASGKER